MKERERINGGLVLKTSEINGILNIPETVGVAFGTISDQFENIDLKIYRVIEYKDNLYGKEHNIKFKKGAASYNDINSDLDYFKFEHATELKNIQFGFAYLEKNQFKNIAKANTEDVFLNSCQHDYGTSAIITGTWPTLMISARVSSSGSSNESIIPLFSPPPSHKLQGCPPVWNYAIPIELESPEFKADIIFTKKNKLVKAEV